MSDDSTETTQQRIVSKSHEVLHMIPLESGLPRDPRPADSLHRTLRESSPQLELLRILSETSDKKVTVLPLLIASVTLSAVLSPLDLVGLASSWQALFGYFGIPVIVGDVLLGAAIGSSSALIHPHLAAWSMPLRSQTKIGTIIGSTGDGELNEVIISDQLEDVRDEVTNAHDRQVQLQPYAVSLAELVGCDPSQIASMTLIGAEIRLRVDDTYDALAKGSTTAELIEDGESALPLDKIGAELLQVDCPALTQTVCQPRLPQPGRVDDATDLIRCQQSTHPLLRHLRLVRDKSNAYYDKEELSSKDQYRVSRLEQLHGDTLYDVNVRGCCLTETNEERQQARQALQRMADAVDGVTTEYVTVDVEWYTDDGGLLGGDPETEILQRIANATVETTPAYSAGVKKNKIRKNLILDAEEVWSLLITPGDGDPRARDARSTLPPSHQPDQRPGEETRDWFGYSDDDGEGEEEDDSADQ